ncbi:hypothetical protein [uncultured Thiodictyon sp.]|jgi:hypothetical protein|uniref:hypothetical protein n=1 Tax=uncultured Thiodictyon sp. TaxID=1846217 RepID=UPI0025FD34B3|nr:hypothetical protein [uncultured Thiodictyon sp.]
MPERVQVNKGYLGFLSHTGFAHGGNGFEAMQFLIERFSGRKPTDPGDPHDGLHLVRIAADYAVDFKLQKAKAKAVGNLSYAKIPCINHPIFKGKEVNLDPREVYVRELFQSRGSYNVFHQFYHELVHALASYGVSSNVYCVNIDAVIAVILLKILWRPYVAGGGRRGLPRIRRLHHLPVRPHHRHGRRDRGSRHPRPQYGYAHGGESAPVCGLIGHRSAAWQGGAVFLSLQHLLNADDADGNLRCRYRLEPRQEVGVAPLEQAG